MKKLFILFLTLGLSLCGCATKSAVTVVGTTHPKIKTNQIQVFSQSPPFYYQEVAWVSAVSRGSMQDAIDRLKKEASKVGANGLILTYTQVVNGGAMGYSFGSANVYANPYGATAYGNSFSGVVPVYYSCAKGTAIYFQKP